MPTCPQGTTHTSKHGEGEESCPPMLPRAFNYIASQSWASLDLLRMILVLFSFYCVFSYYHHLLLLLCLARPPPAASSPSLQHGIAQSQTAEPKRRRESLPLKPVLAALQIPQHGAWAMNPKPHLKSPPVILEIITAFATGVVERNTLPLNTNHKHSKFTVFLVNI